MASRSLFLGILPAVFGAVLAGWSGEAASQPLPSQLETPTPAHLCAWQKDYLFFTGEARAEKLAVASCVQAEKQAAEAALSAGRAVLAASPFAGELRTLMASFPMEAMAERIAGYDREIAGLIVGIGKKESNWGKRTPKLEGEECFNYWGYRGRGDRGFTPDGYGCFHTTDAAVDTIAGRLIELRELRESAAPERMIVWKCGNSCAGHSPESVEKWIADVNIYFRDIALR
jgi:hypothetical protein